MAEDEFADQGVANRIRWKSVESEIGSIDKRKKQVWREIWLDSACLDFDAICFDPKSSKLYTPDETTLSWKSRNSKQTTSG